MIYKFKVNSQVIAVLSVFVFSFWGVFVASIAPHYQAISGYENAFTEGVFRGLAMIEVLFPEFWIILLFFAGICFITFRFFKDKSWLHMLLVGELSLMLFFTPFLLGGFSWSPDSLWHGGVANYIPDILGGSDPILTHYVQSYPFSFLTSFVGQQVLGIGVFNYTLYVYPLFCIVIIAELAYVFASRFLNHRLAFLSILMTLPAWHYFEGHVSPLSFGTIFVFIILILLTSNKRGAVALSLLFMIVLIATHPISPIVLGVFLFSAILANYFVKVFSGDRDFTPKSSLLPIFLFLAVGWFSWTVFQAMNQYAGVEIAVSNVFNFQFINRLIYASGFTVGSDSFIIPEIHQLSIAIYGILFVVLLIGGREFVGVIRQRKELNFDLVQKTLTLSLAAVIYAALGYLLFLSSGERFLLGRGLLFFLFMGFMVITSYFFVNNKRFERVKSASAWLLILFLFCSFPVISYSKEAYNTFTPSANLGLEFIGENLDLSNGRSISMAMDQQLASYVDLNQNFTMLRFPADLNLTSPDIIVLRINAYFAISMRYDLSFDDNRYTQLRGNLSRNSNYNRIYANPDFEIYILAN
jgi:hypothetical protein